MADFDRESMLEMFIYEMSNLLEQLEQIVILGESGFDIGQINEIFRIMHTLKGSAAMMMFDNISTTAHSMEDLFFYLREENPSGVDYSTLTDLILEGMDFIKVEIGKIEAGEANDGDGSEIIAKIKNFLAVLKGQTPAEKPEEIQKPQSGNLKHFKAQISFEENSEMVNIRAYSLVHNLKDKVQNIKHTPDDLVSDEALEIVSHSGLTMEFDSDMEYDHIHEMLSQTIYLKDLILEEKFDSQKFSDLQNLFMVTLRFVDDAEMENIRAYTLIHNISPLFEKIEHEPKELMEDAALDIIKKDGFKLAITTNKTYDEVNKIVSESLFVKEIKIEQKANVAKEKESTAKEISAKHEISENTDIVKEEKKAVPAQQAQAQAQGNRKAQTQHSISVNIGKLDQLLNLMGELVIAEAMVTQNPDLEGLELENFFKETRQLRKIINDVQDTVMSMRMVPLSTTFFKMHRIVRDMCKALDKDIELEIVGEETEVDKNIIEHISDPLMHIIRNSVDHGIERPEDRERLGKNTQGMVRLEAKNSGGDVLIIIRDDGKGIDRDKVLNKAKANGLLKKPEEEYTDKEIYQFIFLPGFSTNEVVTGYSGRGVGMDVVTTNLEAVGGVVLVDSVPGEGSVFTLKIPLTLAIIVGMTIKVAGNKYTIPIISIKQSFKPSMKNIFTDPNGNEMITVRGECYNIVRLNEFFGINGGISNLEEGIMIMLENGDQTVCLFADELLGEQQVVVKSMPKYIKKHRGISGCTLLGNGDISLIIDTAGFFDK